MISYFTLIVYVINYVLYSVKSNKTWITFINKCHIYNVLLFTILGAYNCLWIHMLIDDDYFQHKIIRLKINWLILLHI